MDEFRKSVQFAASMGGGGPSTDFGAPKFSSNFPAERPIVFGSGGAANDNNHNNTSVGAAATKRGRDRPRSASPILRPPIPPNHVAGHQQDAAGKAFGKSPDQQREEEAAKARRLLRFGAEFGTIPRAPAKPASINDDEDASMFSVPSAGVTLEPGSEGVMAGQAKLRDSTTQAGRNEATVGEAVMVDMDAPDNLTSEPILGICPDMCPETERSERERKGDLDRFERVGGNRNQTSRDLAVKKYTRTAEKDALLIRPLVVLKMTMDHLLSLLERDHEDDLLAVHSFLWDRMRAVRMDLRMQHIFTEDALAMHEQMIRFHILAMHELCEFSEGEGISEVFNAHLNIEQMNKASVDLFQMYDDHLKGGIWVPSEAEFRGYYALLKLDKHPGYNVEPAELSLDLANMTREIRNSPEVRFARDVARACRAGNFVAFFRMAREAAYLQACLMHAHFSKLRTQALASLHSGLQKNQGIPLSTAVDWLGMEGEDIDSLIKYHGFSIKYYEEAYMVKEGSFLNRNQDFPTYRSQLVESKRSVRIVMDVKADKHLDTIPETPFELKRIIAMERKRIVRRDSMERKGPPKSVASPALASLETLVQTKEEEMPDYIEETIEEGEIEEIAQVTVAPVAEVVKPRAEEEGKQGKKRRMDEPQFDAEEHERRRLRHQADAVSRRAASQAAAAEIKRKEEERVRAGHDAEAYLGKQGTLFRKWRRRAATKALERHRKQLLTEAALDTLSLGSPLWKMRVGGASLSVAHRSEYTKTLLEDQGLKLQQMWEPLDMPNLVGPILQGQNLAARSLAWRLFLSTADSPSGQWVRTKVGSRRKSGTGQGVTDEARSNISITEESLVMRGYQPGSMVEFQYSVGDLGAAYAGLHAEMFCGIGALLFVTNDEDDMVKERARLNSLVRTLNEGANVPLLVLSTRSRVVHASNFDQSLQQELLQELKLGDLSTSRVSTYRVVSIYESSISGLGTNVYFGEEALREGIVWLAKRCPIQPQLRSLHVSDLLREHLETGLKRLLTMPLSEVNPEHFIKLFNRGIHDTAEEIASNASSFPIGSSPSSVIDEKRFKGAGGTYQTQRLHSQETLEGLFTNLNSCALPPFPPFEHLRKLGSINLQKLAIEQLLFQFLNQVEGNSSENQAVMWEVTRLVQRGCTVEWSESGMKLVPKWAKIFQAIFAARLLLLSIKPWPLVFTARINKSPPEVEPDENGTDKSKSKTGPDFFGDVRLLLNDMIGGEFERPVSTHSELVSPSEEKEKVTRVASLPPSQFENEFVTSDVSHGTPSRCQSMGASNLRTLPKTISTVEKYMGYRLPQDFPLEWLVERDVENQVKRLRLASTESERSLDKMLAEVRRQGHRIGKNEEARKGNRLDAAPDLLPIKMDNPEREHELHIHLSEGRAEFNRVEGEPGSFQELNGVSSQNFLLALSPFEELLDKMVAASCIKGISGSEQYPMGMVTPRRRSHPGIEDYRARYQELQISSWTV